MKQIKHVANYKKPTIDSWVFAIETKDKFGKSIFNFDCTGEKELTLAILAKVVDISDISVTFKIYINDSKYIQITKKLKEYWVLKDSISSNSFLAVDSRQYSNNKGGKMKFSKHELVSFAESLTDALEVVAEKIEAIEDIINGNVESKDEDEVEEVEIDDEEDFVDEPEDEDESAEIEDEEELETDDEDEDESEEENFSKRYANIKNFLTF